MVDMQYAVNHQPAATWHGRVHISKVNEVQSTLYRRTKVYTYMYVYRARDYAYTYMHSSNPSLQPPYATILTYEIFWRCRIDARDSKSYQMR